MAFRVNCPDRIAPDISARPLAAGSTHPIPAAQVPGPIQELPSMRAGLVGFAGSGKSTLFHLLTGATPDPGKVHSGQVGIATLADPRLDFLASLHKPKKITSATVEILDTPGLMPGSHGDNPQRLALIREGDALIIVLGAFSGGDPAADLSAFREELFYADLGV